MPIAILPLKTRPHLEITVPVRETRILQHTPLISSSYNVTEKRESEVGR
jgi:hypothetical protein